MTIKTITVPDLGGASDVVVIEILVKVGDIIKMDQSLVTLESDKATMDVPSTDAGTVKEIKVKVGDKVAQGSPLILVESSAAETTATAPAAQAQPTKIPEPIQKPIQPAAVPTVTAEIKETYNETPHAGPAVRQLARELGIDLTRIVGTGPKNRILKIDVTSYVKARLAQNNGAGIPSAPVVDFAKFGPIETKALSRIKKLSGKNLHRNWLLVPHVTQFGEADITDLEAFRQSQKHTGVKLTPLAFIMKAVVASLKEFPQFNASLDASGENLIIKQYYHIGVAVDTPEGLVVPVIRDVDKKDLTELAKELSVVSEKARNKQLSPQEMQGGSFSISSLGGIGGTAFTPIVNVPEVAILGVSKSSYKPIYQTMVAAENEEQTLHFVPRLMLPLSLSYDHRVIDGADGARFMVHLSAMLSDIRNLLL